MRKKCAIISELKAISRASSKRYREKQKRIANGDVTVTSPDGYSDAIEEDIDIDKEKISSTDSNECLFESLWKLYPRKEGKSQVSKKHKNEGIWDAWEI